MYVYTYTYTYICIYTYVVDCAVAACTQRTLGAQTNEPHNSTRNIHYQHIHVTSTERDIIYLQVQTTLMFKSRLLSQKLLRPSITVGMNTLILRAVTHI